jgi:hypothetical protein
MRRVLSLPPESHVSRLGSDGNLARVGQKMGIDTAHRAFESGAQDRGLWIENVICSVQGRYLHVRAVNPSTSLTTCPTRFSTSSPRRPSSSLRMAVSMRSHVLRQIWTCTVSPFGLTVEIEASTSKTVYPIFFLNFGWAVTGRWRFASAYLVPNWDIPFPFPTRSRKHDSYFLHTDTDEARDALLNSQDPSEHLPTAPL